MLTSITSTRRIHDHFMLLACWLMIAAVIIITTTTLKNTTRKDLQIPSTTNTTNTRAEEHSNHDHPRQW